MNFAELSRYLNAGIAILTTYPAFLLLKQLLKQYRKPESILYYSLVLMASMTLLVNFYQFCLYLSVILGFENDLLAFTLRSLFVNVCLFLVTLGFLYTIQDK